MSTWGYKDEENLLQGLFKIPDHLADTIHIGGDIRYLSKGEVKSDESESEGFLMQSQLRFGFATDNIKFILSLGKIENPQESEKMRWVSPEYYVLWAPKEELFIRAGRFEPIFGLRMPEHNLWIKSEIGFVPWLERDSFEIIYESEKQFASLAGFQSISTVNPALQTTGYTASLYQILGESNRLGVSFMNQEGQGIRKKTISLHGIFSFSEKCYLLTENTSHWVLNQKNDIQFIRLGYELIRGLNLLTQTQLLRNFNSSTSEKLKWGFGFNWLPRPHLELMTIYDKEQTVSKQSDEFMLLLHYYL